MSIPALVVGLMMQVALVPSGTLAPQVDSVTVVDRVGTDLHFDTDWSRAFRAQNQLAVAWMDGRPFLCDAEIVPHPPADRGWTEVVLPEWGPVFGNLLPRDAEFRLDRECEILRVVEGPAPAPEPALPPPEPEPRPEPAPPAPEPPPVDTLPRVLDEILVPWPVAVGGFSYVVAIDGQTLSSHSTLHGALRTAGSLHVRCELGWTDTCPVEIVQHQRYRIETRWEYPPEEEELEEEFEEPEEEELPHDDPIAQVTQWSAGSGRTASATFSREPEVSSTLVMISGHRIHWESAAPEGWDLVALRHESSDEVGNQRRKSLGVWTRTVQEGDPREYAVTWDPEDGSTRSASILLLEVQGEWDVLDVGWVSTWLAGGETLTASAAPGVWTLGAWFARDETLPPTWSLDGFSAFSLGADGTGGFTTSAATGSGAGAAVSWEPSQAALLAVVSFVERVR